MFTVSVGNLPSNATVLIKITYIAELAVEGEKISFTLPGSVAPWKRTQALDDVTQVNPDEAWSSRATQAQAQRHTQAQIVLQGWLNVLFCQNTKGLTTRRRLTALACVVALMLASLVSAIFHIRHFIQSEVVFEIRARRLADGANLKIAYSYIWCVIEVLPRWTLLVMYFCSKVLHNVFFWTLPCPSLLPFFLEGGG